MGRAKMIRRRSCALAIVGSAMLIACAHSPERAPSKPAVSRSPTIPRGLDRFESDVEDAFDTALSGPAGAARAQFQRIFGSWTTLRPVLQRDGAPDELLIRIDERVERLSTVAPSASSIEVARVVNAVSELLDAIFAMYADGPQPLLLRLDYLGRELLLDGTRIAMGSRRASHRADRSDVEFASGELAGFVVTAGGRLV